MIKPQIIALLYFNLINSESGLNKVSSKIWSDKTKCANGDCEANDWLDKLSLIYNEWTEWSLCKEKEDGQMVRTRERRCRVPQFCENMTIKEEQDCFESFLNEEEQVTGTWKRMNVEYEDGRFFVISSNSKRFFKRLGVNLMKSTGHVDKPRKKRIYSKWSRWTICTRSCLTQRYRWCKKVELCGNEVIRQTAYCYTERSACENWILSKIPKDNIIPEAITLSKSGTLDPPHLNPSEHTSSSGSALESIEPSAEHAPLCGILSNTTFQSPQVGYMLRIIGGRPSQNGKWPWVVAVLNRYKEPICGGTLVTGQWVLTAAHCVKKRLYVTIGEYNLAVTEGNEIRLRVRRSITHPDYDPLTVDNDVALLKLPKIMGLHYTMVACLPKPKQPLPKRLCTIIGWGKRRAGDAYGTDILHEARVPIVSNAACRVVYDEYQVITENMFCAGYKRGRMDTCSGDSGGPLLCLDDENRWTVFGITSFGEGCGKKGKYGIYTKLPNYVHWLLSVIRR